MAKQLICTPISVDLSISNYLEESSPFTNAIGKGSDNEGDYAEWSLITGGSAKTYVYWCFDVSSIPSNATITNVSCSARCSNTNASMFQGGNTTVAIGVTNGSECVNKQASSTPAFGTTPKVVTVSSTDYTREELDNFRLKIFAARGFLNTSKSYYTKFYGATLTIDYIENYTVTFKDWNGDVIQTVTVAEGSDATPPSNNPTRDGYRFTGWQGTYTNITSNTDITAQYIKTYNIVASANTGGSISPSGTTTLDEGQSQTYTISVDPEYRIKNVTVDGTDQGAITTYTFSNVTADHTIQAIFEQKPTYTITASSNAGGSISPNGETVVLENGSQSYSISADTRYRISDVKIDGASQGPITSYSFTNVTANHTIEVVFEAIPTYSINITCGDNGTTNPSGTITVYEGESASIVITADIGYRIDKIIQDGIESSGNDQETMTIEFTNIVSNHTLTVSFKGAPTVVAAIEVNKLYAREFFEGEPNISLYIDGIHALDIYEDLNENESIYIDENGILHIHQFIEEVK